MQTMPSLIDNIYASVWFVLYRGRSFPPTLRSPPTPHVRASRVGSMQQPAKLLIPEIAEKICSPSRPPLQPILNPFPSNSFQIIARTCCHARMALLVFIVPCFGTWKSSASMSVSPPPPVVWFCVLLLFVQLLYYQMGCCRNTRFSLSCILV